MFFFRDDKAIIFIHIPKSGGTSIKTLLERNGWENKANFDRGKGHPCYEQWSSIKKEFENNGTVFDFEFALVRNPYDRIESRYWQYRRELGNTTPMALEILNDFSSPVNVKSSFLNGYDNRRCGRKEDFFHFTGFSLNTERFDPRLDDNHFLPQHAFVSDNTEIFKLEEKNSLLDALKQNGYVGKDSKIPHIRSRGRPVTSDIFCEPETENFMRLNLSWNENDSIKKIHDRFLEVYLKDFKTFGYEIDE